MTEYFLPKKAFIFNQFILVVLLSISALFSLHLSATTLVPIQSGNITIFIPVNLPPQSNDDVFTLDEDEPLELDVLANDSDDGNLSNATLEVLTQPGNGAAHVLSGTIRYTPASHYHGTDSFTYRFVDEGGKPSGNATVSLTVNPVNDAPVAVADNFIVAEDHDTTQLTVLSNDSDEDSSALTVELVQTNPLAAFQDRELILSEDALSFSYKAPANTHGEDWFTYRVKDDSNGVSTTVQVSIQITPQNDAPTANNLNVNTDEDTPLTITPFAVDIDGDNLTYLLWDAAQNTTVDSILPTINGSVTIANNQFVYSPGTDFHGTDSFQYVVSDGQANSAGATVSITVNSVNDAPQIISQLSSVTINEDQAKIINILDAITDVDGDELYIESMSVNLGTIERYNNTEFVYTPPPHFNDEFVTRPTSEGIDRIYSEYVRATVMVSDGRVSEPLHWDISVTPIVDVPVFSYYWEKVSYGEAVRMTAVVTDEDVLPGWFLRTYIYNEQGVNVIDSGNEGTFNVNQRFGERSQHERQYLDSILLAPGTYTVEIKYWNGSYPGHSFEQGFTTLPKTLVMGGDESAQNQPPTAVDDHKDDMLPGVAGYDKDLPVLNNDYDDNGDISISLVSDVVIKDSKGEVVQNRVAKPLVIMRRSANNKQITASTDVCFTGEVSANYTIMDEQGLTSSASFAFESNVYDENAAPSPETFAVSTLIQDWTEQDNHITFSWAPVFPDGSTSVEDKSYKLMLLDSQGDGYVVPSITSDHYNATTGLFEYNYALRDPGQYYAYVATCEPGTFDCGCYGDEIAFASYIQWVSEFRALNDVIDSGDTAVLRWKDAEDHNFTLRYKAPVGSWNEFDIEEEDKGGEYTKVLNTAGAHEFQIKVCDPNGNCGGFSSTVTVNVRDNAMAVETAPSVVKTDFGNERFLESARESAKVSLTAGDFRVDESGAATYQIPFSLPQGIAGVTPSLGLSYSSATGNGPAGMGWSIGGLSGISRCRQTIEQDGEAGHLDFGDDARFCLDGQRLMEVTSTGEGSTATKEYRTEIDSKARITSYGPAANPTHFKVEGEDGSVRVYGTINIKNEPVDNAVISSEDGNLNWLLTSISDSVGKAASSTAQNHILFSYQNHASTEGDYHFELLPDAVIYSGNRVEFEWQERQDTKVNFSNSVAHHATQLLDKVVIYHHTGEALRNYDVDYESDHASNIARVHKVTECAFIETDDSEPSVCREPTVFKWYDVPEMSELGAGTYLTGFGNGDVVNSFAVDMQNDGFPDVILMTWEAPNKYMVYQSLYNDGSLSTPVSIFNFTLETTSTNQVQLIPVDIDADGETELVYKTNYQWCYWDNSSGSSCNSISTVPISAKQLTVNDINADAFPDLIYRLGSEYYVRLNNGSAGFGNAINTEVSEMFPCTHLGTGDIVDCADAQAVNHTLNIRPTAISDFNGDGQADFLFELKSAGPVINLGSYPGEDDIQPTTFKFIAMNLVKKEGGGFHFELADELASHYTEEINAVIPYFHFTSGDINSDGLSDILFFNVNLFNRSTSLNVWYGGANDDDIRVPVSIFDKVRDDISNVNIADMNKDGRPDIAYFNKKNHSWYVVYQDSEGTFVNSNGALKSAIRLTSGDKWNAEERDLPLLADWDADGEPGFGFVDVTSKKVRYYSDLFVGAVPSHSLRKIINGFEVETRIEYRQLTDTEVYTRGTQDADGDPVEPSSLVWGAGSPVFDLISPSFVVSEVTSGSDGYSLTGGTALARLNGAATELSVSYHYQGLRAQAGGRGMLGFERISTTDDQRNIVTTTVYHQDFPYIGMPKSTTQVLKKDGEADKTLSFSENRYGHYVIKRGDSRGTSYFPYLDVSTERLYGVDSNNNVHHIGTVITDNTWTAYSDDNHYNLFQTTVSHYEEGDTTTLLKSVFTENEYADATTASELTDWHLGRLSATEVTHTYDGDTDVRKSTFEYYPSGATKGMLKREIIAPQGNEQLKLTTLHCYDSVGNKTGQLTHSNHHDKENCNSDPDPTTSAYQVFRKQLTTWSSDDSRYVLNTSNGVFTTQTIAKSSYNRFDLPTKTQNIDGVETEYWYTPFGGVYASHSDTGERRVTERRLKADIADIRVPAIIQKYHYVEKVSAPYDGKHGMPASVSYFDKLGRKVASATAGFNPGEWYATLYSYDLYGKMLSQSSPFTWTDGSHNMYRHYTEYDWMGRPVKITPAHGATTSLTYTEGGLVISASMESDKPTQVKKTVKNILGETTQVVDDDGGINVTVDYSYHASGALHEATTGGNVVTTTFDDYGRKTEMDDPDKGEWDYTYNALGELVTQTKKAVTTDNSDVTTTFTRDNIGRTVSRHTGSEETKYYYGIIDEDDPAIVTSRHQLTKTCFIKNNVCDTKKPVKTPTYDGFGRAHEVTTTINDSSHVSMVSRTTFDGFGRVFQQFDDYENRYGLRHHYNSQGYAWIQEEARYSDSCDARTREHFRGCSNKVYQKVTGMNALGKVTSWRQNNNIIENTNRYYLTTGLLHQSQVQSDNATIQLNDYRYDELGNLKSRHRNSLHGGLAVIDDLRVGYQSFGYDNLNRLTRINSEDQVSYDASGNITWKRGVGHYCYTGNRLNKVSASDEDCSDSTAFTYDDWGNITSNPIDEGERTITYSEFDKAESITSDGKTTTFEYDTGRSRYERITDLEGTKEQRTLYFGNVERIYERDSDTASWEFKETRRNLPGAIQTIHVQGLETTHFQHKDNLGSVNTVTNENGRIVQKMYFDPWGKKHRLGLHMWADDAKAMQAPTLAGILDITPRGFTGHEHVDHADIIHMNGRIYDPTLGRFLQADPFIQAPQNSQSFNRYAYVLNNPLSYTDPSGYFFKKLWKGIKKFAAVIAGVLVAAYCPQCTATLWSSVFTGAAIGAGSAALNGGNILKGALIGAFSGAAFQQIGAHFTGAAEGSLGHVLAHGVTGGITSVLQGGKFGHGFLSAGLTKALNINKIIGTAAKDAGLRVATAAIVGGTISKITGGKFANGAITAAFAQAFNGEVAAAKHEFEIGLNKAFKRLGIESGGALKINDEGIAVQSDTDIGDLNIKFDSNGEVSMVSKNSIGLTVDVANDVFKEIIQDFSPVQLSLSAGKNNHIDYSLSLGLKSPIVLGWKVTGSINMSEMFKWHPIEQRARTHDGIKNSKYCQYIKCDTLGGN